MIRIIDGLGRPSNAPGFDISTATAFMSQGTESYRVRAYDLGNGQLEASASRLVTWVECDWSEGVIRDHLAMVEKYREDHADEVAARHAARAAQGARKKVRHLCKSMGVDTILTLTYRALVLDLKRCKRHVNEFNRRVKRLIPGLRMVAGYERQKRGAWHVHLATSGVPKTFLQKNALGVPSRVKSFDLLRSIWLSVVGDLGGACNVSRHHKRGSSCAKIAAYISKYITKEFETGEKWSNRWGKFGDVDAPQIVEFTPRPLVDALSLMGSLVLEGQSVGQFYLPRFKDFVYLACEGPLH